MLVININWEYFIAVIGTLIALAYYANGRFTKLEISVEWLRNAIESLTRQNEPATRASQSRRLPFPRQSKVRRS